VSKLPTDEQMVLAIKHKKDLFVSRFVKGRSKDWVSIDEWYFNHICTVLNHAEKIFNTPVDDLTSTNFEQ